MHDPIRVPEPKISALFANRKLGHNRPTQPVPKMNCSQLIFSIFNKHIDLKI